MMKLSLVICAVVGVSCVSAANLVRSANGLLSGVSNNAEEMIEGWKKDMPCGFPAVGIPPLAPLKIAHKTVNLTGTNYNLNIDYDQFTMTGLDDFAINSLQMHVLNNSVNLSFTWNSIRTVSNFDTNSQVTVQGKVQNIVGNGLMDITMVNMNVNVWAKYQVNVLTEKMSISEMSTVVTVGQVISATTGTFGSAAIGASMNAYIEELLKSSINGNPDDVSDIMNVTLLPVINDVLEDITWEELVNGVQQSGAQPACVPPVGDEE